MSPGNITRAWDCFYTLNRDFLYFVVLSSRRGYHTILWTNIIVLNQWNTKAEVPAGSVFLCTGKSYSSFLSTTKRDPLNVLSYVEQKVSEKAEKQCCKKDITYYITQIYQIWRLNKCICRNDFVIVGTIKWNADTSAYQNRNIFTEMEKDGMIRKRNVVSGEGYRSILVVPDMLFSFMRCTKAW